MYITNTESTEHVYDSLYVKAVDRRRPTLRARPTWLRLGCRARRSRRPTKWARPT